jgi:hypothetical protein
VKAIGRPTVAVRDELKAYNYPWQDAAQATQPALKQRMGSVVHLIIFLSIFVILSANEYRMERGKPDAILNSSVLTLVLATVYFAIRKRVLR